MPSIEVYDESQSGALVASTGPTVEDGNRATIEEQAADALATTNTFLALQSPTNAQTLAQVRHLSRVSKALIRMQLADFSSAD